VQLAQLGHVDPGSGRPRVQGRAVVQQLGGRARRGRGGGPGLDLVTWPIGDPGTARVPVP
jgi:hypothetical protein